MQPDSEEETWQNAARGRGKYRLHKVNKSTRMVTTEHSRGTKDRLGFIGQFPGVGQKKTVLSGATNGSVCFPKYNTDMLFHS